MRAHRAKVPRIRRHLADTFGRTESQIRDDLTKATRQNWLAMAYPRSTTRHPGDRMRRERPADFNRYNKGASK